MTAPATNVREFSLSISSQKIKTREQAVLAQRKITLQVLRGIVRGTPVDTGRLRASWTATAGAPATSEVGGDQIGDLRFGQPSFVTSIVEYAGHVNATHPNKSGWVQAAVQNVANQFSGSVVSG